MLKVLMPSLNTLVNSEYQAIKTEETERVISSPLLGVSLGEEVLVPAFPLSPSIAKMLSGNIVNIIITAKNADMTL